MICSFQDRGTEDIFNGSDTRAARRACSGAVWSVARSRLDRIICVRAVRESAVLPGNRLERLRGGSTTFGLTTNIASAFVGSVAMRTKSKSPITTERDRTAMGKNRGQEPMARRFPSERPPTHPGEMLSEKLLKPLGISQSAFAIRLGVSFPRLNGIIRGKCTVTPDTALRLARVLGMSADFRLGLQQDWDLWHAMRSDKIAEIDELEPPGRTA